LVLEFFVLNLLFISLFLLFFNFEFVLLFDFVIKILLLGEESSFLLSTSSSEPVLELLLSTGLIHVSLVHHGFKSALVSTEEALQLITDLLVVFSSCEIFGS